MYLTLTYLYPTFLFSIMRLQQYIAASLAVLTGKAIADEGLPLAAQVAGRLEADALVGVAATPTANAALVARRDQRECASDLVSSFGIPTPTADSIKEYITEHAYDRGFRECSITAAASLTSGFASYYGEMRSWASTAQDVADGVDDLCGLDSFTISYQPYCTESVTIFASANGTANKAASTVIPGIENPGNIAFHAGSSPLRPVASLLIGVVGLGAMLVV